jgi:hypothetical protein
MEHKKAPVIKISKKKRDKTGLDLDEPKRIMKPTTGY